MTTAIMKRLFALLPLVILAGCASSYHCYPCGKVSCNYCPPNPLPYSSPESCNCNDSIGQKYLANMPSGVGMGESLQNSQNTSNLDYYVVPQEK